MNEYLIFYSRSLLYGMMMGAIITYIVSLGFGFKKVSSSNGRFIFGLSMVAMSWLFMEYFFWFWIDSYNLAEKPPVSGLISFVGMVTVMFFCVILTCISTLRRIRVLRILFVLLPIVLCGVAYVITNNPITVMLGYIYLALFVVVNSLIVSRNIKRYQKLLNETYANTSMRGVSWIYTLYYPMLVIGVVWVFLGLLYPTELGDCISMVLSIVLWGFFVNRLRVQNFNIKVMEEIEESEEEVESDVEDEEVEDIVAEVEKQDVTTETVVVASDELGIPKPELPQVTVKLKAWQEPRFAAAVEAFCNDEANFTNCDLSVQDVATGVGTNRTYVSKWFKEQGTDFSSYMNEIRLKHAEHLLVTTLKPIIEIVEMSGFSNPRHFRTTFAARYGCPPSEYRTSKGQ